MMYLRKERYTRQAKVNVCQVISIKRIHASNCSTSGMQYELRLVNKRKVSSTGTVGEVHNGQDAGSLSKAK